MKLLVDISIRDNITVIARVVHQEERLRRKGLLLNLPSSESPSGSCFDLMSVSVPAIGYDVLYVRGSEMSRDNDVMYLRFGTPEEAHVYVDAAKKALSVFNGCTVDQLELSTAYCISRNRARSKEGTA